MYRRIMYRTKADRSERGKGPSANTSKVRAHHNNFTLLIKVEYAAVVAVL